MSYFLFAESDLAKTFQGSHGPDILVGDDTRIGRSVSGRDSCRLPAKWAQVSGNHCKIFYTSLKEPAGYWIEDTSTNGTLVNAVKIGKLSSVPLAEGDKVQLSWSADSSPATLLEYIFRKQEAGTDHDGPGKRRRSCSITDESPDGKRTRAGGDGDALLKSVAQLEQSNQDLRKRLDAERSQKEQFARQLTAVKEEVAAAAQAAQEDAALAQQQAQAKADKDAEAANAAIQAAEERASSLATRALEAEQKLASETAAHTESDNKFAELEVNHTALQMQEAKLSAEVAALKEEVASLKAGLSSAEQHTTELEQQLASEAESGKATLEALEKQSETLQAETEAAATARDLADEAVQAAAESKAAEEEQKAARQAADTKLASTEALLEEAQRAQQRALEQQHNAEEVLSVKLALLQSMAQRFAQAGEAKRKAAELQVKAQERIAQADEDMRALGQQLMYAAAGKLQSNSDTKTAFQGEMSGGAPTQGQGGGEGVDPTRPDTETAIQQPSQAPEDTAAQPQDSPTLQLQLNRASTQHTQQANLPVIEDTQENQAEPQAALQEEEALPVTHEEVQSSASDAPSDATSASTSPSIQSSSKGPDGDENVNNNSMDVDGVNGDEVAQKPDRASAVSKVQSSGNHGDGIATVPNNPSLGLRLPETAVYGQSMGNNTLDEFAGME